MNASICAFYFRFVSLIFKSFAPVTIMAVVKSRQTIRISTFYKQFYINLLNIQQNTALIKHHVVSIREISYLFCTILFLYGHLLLSQKGSYPTFHHPRVYNNQCIMDCHRNKPLHLRNYQTIRLYCLHSKGNICFQ